MAHLAAQQTESDSSDYDVRKAQLREIVRAKSLLVGKEWRLASGATSKFYFEMKWTTLDPEGSNLISHLILDVLAEEKVDAIGGLEMGAVPVVACVSQRSHQVGRPIPAFLVRKLAKEHGTEKLIEPGLTAGSTVIVVDDVTTTGGSVLQAIEAVRSAGCHVSKVVTVVDRLEGASQNLAEHGVELIALLDSDDFDVAR